MSAAATSVMTKGVGFAVGGLTPLSTADWPGMLAAVVFCRGCAWNCPYCHNAGLRPFAPAPDAPQGDKRDWPQTLTWLETRRGLLDAVVFSGGEPLLQPDLSRAMTDARGLGFAIGLHTSAMRPEALAGVLPLCDWVGLDVKAPRAAYGRVTGVSGSAEAAWRGLNMLRQARADFELRTTWHPDVLSRAELLTLAGEIGQAFADGGEPVLWAVQAFQPDGCADAALAEHGRAHVPTSLAEELRAALDGAVRLEIRE